MFGKQGEEKKYMTQEEAFDLIKEWGDEMEVRLIDEDFEEVQKELWKAVQRERISFDIDTEIFNYVLKKPILGQDGKAIISKIKIQECMLSDKKSMQGKKNDVDTVVEMYKSYCRIDNKETGKSEEIPIGHLSKIMDRDANIINAIILGFFVQAVPSQRA